jgi:hypothetical protein
MKKLPFVVPIERIANAIFLIRDQKVLLDSTLAELYGVDTKTLNRAVKRNADRFPLDFMFRLDEQEVANLRCQIGTSSSVHGGRRYLPFAFTEQGVAMLSSVLNSPRAIQVNIAIMRAFIKLREALATNQDLSRKFADLESRVGDHDEKFAEIIEAIRQLISPPADETKREMGFHVKESSPPYRTRRKTF